MISCAANCGPLSVVIDLTGSPLSRMSLTTAFASGTACFPVLSFSMSIKLLFGGFAPPAAKANLRGVFHGLMHRRVLHF